MWGQIKIRGPIEWFLKATKRRTYPGRSSTLRRCFALLSFPTAFTTSAILELVSEKTPQREATWSQKPRPVSQVSHYSKYGHLAALVKSRSTGNKQNNTPNATNTRASTHRKPIRNETPDSCYIKYNNFEYLLQACKLERSRGTAARRMGSEDELRNFSPPFSARPSTSLTPISSAVVHLARSSLSITKRKERDCVQSGPWSACAPATESLTESQQISHGVGGVVRLPESHVDLGHPREHARHTADIKQPLEVRYHTLQLSHVRLPIGASEIPRTCPTFFRQRSDGGLEPCYGRGPAVSWLKHRFWFPWHQLRWQAVHGTLEFLDERWACAVTLRGSFPTTSYHTEQRETQILKNKRDFLFQPQAHGFPWAKVAASARCSAMRDCSTSRERLHSLTEILRTTHWRHRPS